MSISEIILAVAAGWGLLLIGVALFWRGAHSKPTPKPDWTERRLS